MFIVERQNRTPNRKMLSLAKCTRLMFLIKSNQKHWTGQIVRMEDLSLFRRLYHGEQLHGKRPKHKPRKCYKYNIWNILNWLKNDILNLGNLPLRSASRSTFKTGCVSFEESPNGLKVTTEEGIIVKQLGSRPN